MQQKRSYQTPRRGTRNESWCEPPAALQTTTAIRDTVRGLQKEFASRAHQAD